MTPTQVWLFALLFKKIATYFTAILNWFCSLQIGREPFSMYTVYVWTVNYRKESLSHAGQHLKNQGSSLKANRSCPCIIASGCYMNYPSSMCFNSRLPQRMFDSNTKIDHLLQTFCGKIVLAKTAHRIKQYQLHAAICLLTYAEWIHVEQYWREKSTPKIY